MVRGNEIKLQNTILFRGRYRDGNMEGIQLCVSNMKALGKRIPAVVAYRILDAVKISVQRKCIWVVQIRYGTIDFKVSVCIVNQGKLHVQI